MIELRRELLGWYRALLFPDVLGGLLSCVAIFTAVAFLILHHAFFGPAARQLMDYSEALHGFVLAVAVLVGLYGLQRGLRFHPALDYRYHRWLETSPWAPGDPLPKGPITPTWQDAVFLTAATLATSTYADQMPDPAYACVAPTIAMAASLTVAWSLANLTTRNLHALYGAALTTPAVGLTLHDSEVTGVAVGLVASSVVAYFGVVAGMETYPWKIYPRDKNYLRRLFNQREERQVANWQQHATVGWPYAQLIVPMRDCRVSRTRAAVETTVVAAWVAYLGRGLTTVPEAVWLGLVYVVIPCVGIKLVANLPLVCPKLCLGERLARRRPLLWSHDVLLLEPLVIILATVGFGAAWVHFDWGHDWIGAALTAAIGVWLLRRLGRPVAERFYTGRQMIQGVGPQRPFFERLTAPGD